MQYHTFSKSAPKMMLPKSHLLGYVYIRRKYVRSCRRSTAHLPRSSDIGLGVGLGLNKQNHENSTKPWPTEPSSTSSSHSASLTATRTPSAVASGTAGLAAYSCHVTSDKTFTQPPPTLSSLKNVTWRTMRVRIALIVTLISEISLALQRIPFKAVWSSAPSRARAQAKVGLAA